MGSTGSRRLGPAESDHGKKVISLANWYSSEIEMSLIFIVTCEVAKKIVLAIVLFLCAKQRKRTQNLRNV